jgi:hypothetical protein
MSSIFRSHLFVGFFVVILLLATVALNEHLIENLLICCLDGLNRCTIDLKGCSSLLYKGLSYLAEVVIVQFTILCQMSSDSKLGDIKMCQSQLSCTFIFLWW